MRRPEVGATTTPEEPLRRGQRGVIAAPAMEATQAEGADADNSGIILSRNHVEMELFLVGSRGTLPGTSMSDS
jgi:hypothetical protein